MFLYKLRLFILGYSMHALAWILQLQLHPKVSVLGFIQNGDKFLVLDLSYRNGYAFPGGLVEGTESLEAALAREIYEETGLTITSATYITSKKDVQYRFPVLAVAYHVETTGQIKGSTEGDLHFKTVTEIIANCAYKNSIAAFKTYLSEYQPNLLTNSTTL